MKNKKKDARPAGKVHTPNRETSEEARGTIEPKKKQNPFGGAT